MTELGQRWVRAVRRWFATRDGADADRVDELAREAQARGLRLPDYAVQPLRRALAREVLRGRR
jgi:hypothetical protein